MTTHDDDKDDFDPASRAPASDRDKQHWSEAEEGMELLSAGEVDAAVATLQRAAEANPRNEYALFFLGNAYFEQKQWDRALKAYVIAISLAPDYIGAMIGAGHALIELGRTSEAIRMAHEVERRRKDDADALYLLGVAHFRRGDEAKAREYLEAYLATRPEAEVDLEVRGMLEVLGGRVVSISPGDDTIN